MEDNKSKDEKEVPQTDAAEVSNPNFAKPNVISRFIQIVANGFKLGYWAFKNPLTINPSNFKMPSDLLGLILAVAKEDRHRMTHIAFVHPTEGEQQIVSIWAGAGMDADPTKRIAELLAENTRLKIELSKRVVSVENGL